MRSGLDAQIARHVRDWWLSHRVASIGVYWPMRGEPDLRELYGFFTAQGVRLALPLTAEKNSPLTFGIWHQDAPLQRDVIGCMVPASCDETLRPDALLIPCVGFNARRQRLGYGGGYYDRTLAATPRPLAIGIAYSCSECDFEGNEHDIALDRVITELA